MEFEYNDPIIYYKRSGLKNNPYSDMVEDLIVDNNGRVYLTEEPDYYFKVKVEGLDQDWYEVTQQELGTKTYRVDYKNKVVTFDKSHIGEQLQFSYRGKGLKFIPANSIYTEVDGLEVKETIQRIVDEGRDGIDIIYGLNQDEAGRVKNENKRIEDENERKSNESIRMGQEDKRKQNELVRQEQEIARQNEISNTIKAKNDAIESSRIANESADYANEQGDYAKAQGVYAKEQGDYAKGQAGIISELRSDINSLSTVLDGVLERLDVLETPDGEGGEQ